MASVFPGGLDNFDTNRVNATPMVNTHPADHDDLADAVNKIEAELGVDPAGGYATVVARLDAGLPAPGMVIRYDLGVVTFADIQDAALTLYTPAAGEIVAGVYLRDVTFTDTSKGIMIASSDGITGLENALGIVTAIDWTTIVPVTGGAAYDNTAATVIRAGFSEDIESPIADAWQANHHYVPDANVNEAFVVAAGHMWITPDDGISGGSEPDFAGNIGGSVVDNEVTWIDNGALPTAGSVHVYADVAVPVVP